MWPQGTLRVTPEYTQMTSKVSRKLQITLKFTIKYSQSDLRAPPKWLPEILIVYPDYIQSNLKVRTEYFQSHIQDTRFLNLLSSIEKDKS